MTRPLLLAPLFLGACGPLWQDWLPAIRTSEPLLGEPVADLPNGAELRAWSPNKVEVSTFEVLDDQGAIPSSLATVGSTVRVVAEAPDDVRLFVFLPVPDGVASDGDDDEDTDALLDTASAAPRVLHRVYAAARDASGDSLRIDLSQSGDWWTEDRAYRWGFVDGSMDHDVALVPADEDFPTP